MDLTPGVIIIVAVVAVVSFVLIRRALGKEAAAPVEGRITPVKSSAPAAREGREIAPLVNWLLDRATEQTGTSVANDALARERITQAAVIAMEHLRDGRSTTISLPFLTADASGPRHFNVEFRRNPDSTFELQG